MIQRIQTIFLLLAGAAFASLIQLSFATSDQLEIRVFSDNKYTIMDIPILQILTYASIAAVFVGIFAYKRRMLQLRIVYSIILLGLFILVIAYLYYYWLDVPASSVEIGFGAFMPLVASLCALLASIYIRKDERLVKSMDRLR